MMHGLDGLLSLVRSRIHLFGGDEFTEWLHAQEEAARTANAALATRQEQRDRRTNAVADDMFGGKSRKRKDHDDHV